MESGKQKSEMTGTVLRGLSLNQSNGDCPSTEFRLSPHAKVVSLNISAKKGQKKQPVDSIYLVKDKGVEADAHYDSERQVSLLPYESIKKMKNEGLNVGAGSFAENITTKGLNLSDLQIGTRLKLGNSLVEITEIGKDCHTPCAIYKQAGYCVMPEDGIFAKVLRGGIIRNGEKIEVLN